MTERSSQSSWSRLEESTLTGSYYHTPHPELRRGHKRTLLSHVNAPADICFSPPSDMRWMKIKCLLCSNIQASYDSHT